MEKKNKKIELSTLIYGKVPPHATELEEQVLGIMLLFPETIVTVKQFLNPTDFYSEKNINLCKGIYEVSENTTVDIMLVLQWAMNNNCVEEVGGVYGITQLTVKVVETKNIEAYCGVIKQKSIQRKLVQFSGYLIENAYDNTENIGDLLAMAENKLKGINHELDEIKYKPISDTAISVVEKFNNKVHKARNGIKDENLIYTGIDEWDKVNGALFPALYVVAGRPGMGKGVHMTELICRMGKMYNIGIINGEMTEEQLLRRVGCNLKDFDNFLYKKDPQYVTDQELEMVQEAMEEALKLNIHIENSRHIHKISNKIKLWKEKYNVKCILADFLTLFKVPPELDKYYTEKQKVDYVLDVFVSLAKELEIPIILYAQMNRQILGRHGNKEPNLADLKQSGSIEELAYQVCFLHRPEYYDEKATTDEFGEDIKGLMYQIIAKHREGEMNVRLKFRGNLGRSQIKSWDNNPFTKQSIIDSPF